MVVGFVPHIIEPLPEFFLGVDLVLVHILVQEVDVGVPLLADIELLLNIHNIVVCSISVIYVCLNLQALGVQAGMCPDMIQFIVLEVEVIFRVIVLDPGLVEASDSHGGAILVVTIVDLLSDGVFKLLREVICPEFFIHILFDCVVNVFISCLLAGVVVVTVGGIISLHNPFQKGEVLVALVKVWVQASVPGNLAGNSWQFVVHDVGMFLVQVASPGQNTLFIVAQM